MALISITRQRISLASAPLFLAAGLLTGCNSDDDNGGMMGPDPDPGATSTLNGIDNTAGEDNIVALPGTVDARITAVFDRYTQFTAPNGQRVSFLSQDGVPDDLLVRTRGLVRQHLTDFAGSSLGADKSAAFNAAASAGATFVLFENAASFDDADADVIAFRALFGDQLSALDASTIVREGSPSFIQVAPAHDPSIGATARFALAQGILTEIPGFQTDLEAASANAVAMGIYDPGAIPAAEIDAEYLVVALDTYYGLYGHDPNGNGTAGLTGEYMALDRTDMQSADPDGLALIESFFLPTHRYSAFLDPTFNGEFESTFDPVIDYTHRSQYLERIGIRETSTARVNGNELNNIFLGNTTGSTFEGRGGNDSIDGFTGADTAIYNGPSTEYTITTVGDVTTIIDSAVGRDDTDFLRGITQLMFTDMTVNL